MEKKKRVKYVEIYCRDRQQRKEGGGGRNFVIASKKKKVLLGRIYRFGESLKMERVLKKKRGLVRLEVMIGGWLAT